MSMVNSGGHIEIVSCPKQLFLGIKPAVALALWLKPVSLGHDLHAFALWLKSVSRGHDLHVRNFAYTHILHT